MYVSDSDNWRVMKWRRMARLWNSTRPALVRMIVA